MKKSNRLEKHEIKSLVEGGQLRGLTVLRYDILNNERQLRVLPDILLKRIVTRLRSYRTSIDIPIDIDLIVFSEDWSNNIFSRHEIEQMIYFISDAMRDKYKTIVIDDQRYVHLFTEIVGE